MAYFLQDGGPHEWKVRKPSDNDLDAGVPTTTIGRTTPTEIPRAETLCHRDDDHEASPTLSKSGQRSGQNAGEYPRESPKEFPLHSSQKHCSDESLTLGRDGSLARFQTTPDTDNESIDNRRHEGELYIREGEVDLAAASYREIERAPSPLIPGNSDRNHYSGDLDGSVSGDEGNFNGYKPTRHNDVDAVVENASPRRCNNYDGGSSNNLNDYGESDHVHNRFDLRETVGTEDSRTLSMDGSSVRSDGTYADNGDGTLSLSGDSTEWTPLRGSRYLGRLKGNEPGDWTVRFADEQVGKRGGQRRDIATFTSVLRRGYAYHRTGRALSVAIYLVLLACPPHHAQTQAQFSGRKANRKHLGKRAHSHIRKNSFPRMHTLRKYLGLV